MKWHHFPANGIAVIKEAATILSKTWALEPSSQVHDNSESGLTLENMQFLKYQALNYYGVQQLYSKVYFPGNESRGLHICTQIFLTVLLTIPKST